LILGQPRPPQAAKARESVSRVWGVEFRNNGSSEVGLAEVGPSEVGPAEVGPYEVGPYEVGPAEVDPAEVFFTDFN